MEAASLRSPAQRSIPRPRTGDLVAGASVAMVLIPQSLAYSELAGMPPVHGLYASALPPLLAAFFASSPYLQTGPVAITSLLTFGALSTQAPPGSGEYVALGLLLAGVVGVVRLLIGWLRAGVIAYLMSQPLLMGFTPAAAILIAASQLPAALGASPPTDSVLPAAGWALVHPADWRLDTVAFAAGALGLMLAGRRIHPLFPGVLIAVVAAVTIGSASDYGGTTVGNIDPGLPPLSLDLPWASLGSLIVPGAVIALVGFAEAGSIARVFAAADRKPWSSDREFVSQGVANLTSAVSGGYPVGGSFSRSSLNRLAGAETRWSGAVTGLVVLAALPFVSLLAPAPSAVLAAVVIGAVLGLIRLGRPLRLWRYSKPQFAVAWITFGLTLALAPHIERAVLIGVGLSVAVHLWRQMSLEVESEVRGSELVLRPRGVLWFGSSPRLEEEFMALLARNRGAESVAVELDGLGRLDTTGALALRGLLRHADNAGMRVELREVPPQFRRLTDGLLSKDGAHPLG
jgi:sulfate permease, SulP family